MEGVVVLVESGGWVCWFCGGMLGFSCGEICYWNAFRLRKLALTEGSMGAIALL